VARRPYLMPVAAGVGNAGSGPKRAPDRRSIAALYPPHLCCSSVQRKEDRPGMFRLSTKALIAALFLAAPFLAGLTACAPREAPPPAPPRVEPPVAPPPVPLPEVFDPEGRMIVEAMEYPWSALGRLNAGGRGFCTGALIAPDLVVASAHCLYNAVEGRWWTPNELHFVAGYQRDEVVLHAPVAGYEVGPGYRGGAGASLANVAANWSLVTLAQPLGARTGWLALQDPGAGAAGMAAQAGYRRGWAHSITLKLTCRETGEALAASAAGGGCADAPGESELPVLLIANGEARLLGHSGLLRAAEAGAIETEAFRRLPRNSAIWGAARPPRAGGPAAIQPRDTAMRLLLYLGYLEGIDLPADDVLLRAAILRFQRDRGLPQSGRPDLALLRHLMAAAQEKLLREIPRVSTAPYPATTS